MSEAPAVGEKRLAWVSSLLILPDRVLNILTVERVFQLGRENRNAVQEQDQVEALLVLLAVTKLAHSGEKIRRVQALEVFVQPARGPEVRKLKLAAGILDAIAQHVERAAPLDLPFKEGRDGTLLGLWRYGHSHQPPLVHANRLRTVGRLFDYVRYHAPADAFQNPSHKDWFECYAESGAPSCLD